MQMANYTSSNGSSSDDTILNFEKSMKGPVPASSPLIYYYTVNKSWERREIPVEILQFKIGNNPYECEVQIENPEVDKVQIVIRRIEDLWHIIEAGKNDLMHVNGEKRRQAVLQNDSSILITICDIMFVFSTRCDKLKLHKDTDALPQSGPPQEGEYSLAANGTELRFPFGHPCLIGSNPLCDFHINSKPFTGLITHSGKRLFFTPLVLNHEIMITKDGLNIMQKTPLAPGSKIKIDTIELGLKLSKDLRFSQDFKFEPDPKEERLMLLQLEEDGTAGKAYAMPPEGNSIFIGREPSQAGLVITGSIRISRRHAQAIIYDKSILLIDNNATNGTFVNTQKIKKHLVHPGDIIRLGNLNFILCYVS